MISTSIWSFDDNFGERSQTSPAQIFAKFLLNKPFVDHIYKVTLGKFFVSMIFLWLIFILCHSAQQIQESSDKKPRKINRFHGIFSHSEIKGFKNCEEY